MISADTASEGVKAVKFRDGIYAHRMCPSVGSGSHGGWLILLTSAVRMGWQKAVNLSVYHDDDSLQPMYALKLPTPGGRRSQIVSVIYDRSDLVISHLSLSTTVADPWISDRTWKNRKSRARQRVCIDCNSVLDKGLVVGCHSQVKSRAAIDSHFQTAADTGHSLGLHDEL